MPDETDPPDRADRRFLALSELAPRAVPRHTAVRAQTAA